MVDTYASVTLSPQRFPGINSLSHETKKQDIINLANKTSLHVARFYDRRTGSLLSTTKDKVH